MGKQQRRGILLFSGPDVTRQVAARRRALRLPGGKPIVHPCIAVLGFALGCGMSLESLVAGGLSGILLAVICLVIGVATAAFDRLTGGSGKAGMACSTIAGTAMTTPPALAASDASYAALVPVATAQIAAAVIITALAAPLLTGWLDNRLSSRES